MVGARSIRLVVAGSAGAARRAAKSGISARNGATVASSSSSPAKWARALDHGHSSARLSQPRDHRIERDVTRSSAGQRSYLLNCHRNH